MTTRRAVFGEGTVGLISEEMERLGKSRPLILSTPTQKERVETVLRGLKTRSAGHFSDAAMHTPVDVSEQASNMVRDTGADCVIAVGGGSTIGLSKAVALRTGLAQIVVPTTYAGSEVTTILGQTEKDEKTTIRAPAILPDVVIYDVNLTLSLPTAQSVTSGFNAIAHAIEALYAKDGTPLTTMMAVEGIRAIYRSLPIICENPLDKTARSDALYGAWLCGLTLNATSMGLHHKLCHIIGGALGLPHAETHALILPHVISYNTTAAPQTIDQLSEITGSENPAEAIFERAVLLGVEMSLASFGVTETDIDHVSGLAVSNPYSNPAPLDLMAIRALLENALHGRKPSSSLKEMVS